MQRGLDLIRSKIAEMAQRDGRALEDCVKALSDKNRQLAYSIMLRDHAIDELEKEIDRLCLEFIVRNQPVAGPLRFLYSTIKINLELERIGDYAESIARQVLKLSAIDARFPMERFAEIANHSIPMLRDAIAAFLNQDAEAAKRVMEVEEAVDVLKSKLNADIVQWQIGRAHV